MKEYLEILKKVNLFYGFLDSEILSILNCLNAKTKNYTKNSVILSENNFSKLIGIVIKGELQNVFYEINGAQSIIASFTESDIFAESLVCAQVERPPIMVYAVKDSTVMYLDYKKILSVCSNTCVFHQKLIQNMLKILAEKNLYLNQKLNHLTKRTTKEKLLSYLNDVSKQCGSKSFKIPFSRQELADYLSVERSAMSAELSKLKNEGILDFNKNSFTIK